MRISLILYSEFISAPVTLSNLPSVTTLCHETKKKEQGDEACSIGSAGSLVKRILPSHTISWDTNSSSINTSDGELELNLSSRNNKKIQSFALFSF